MNANTSANTSVKEAAMRMLDGRVAATLGRALPAAALVAALALGAWLGAGWFVYFSTPPAVPAVPAREKVTIAAAAQAAAEAHVFGAAPVAGGIAVSTLNVKLKGVFAGGAGAPGYAIVNTGGRDQSASVGAEISPGVALDSVHARHIVLKRNGIFERVNLEERPMVAQAAPRPVAPPPAAAPAPPAPAGQTSAPPQPPAGPGARFQRPEPYAPVGDVPTEPPPPPTPAPSKAPAKQGGTPGLVVSSVPAGSLLERIGLRPGDVVTSVNGQPVANEADVARVLQGRSPLAPLNAEVVRGGAIIPLTVSAATALRP
jgi:general secretion pathway protein C